MRKKSTQSKKEGQGIGFSKCDGPSRPEPAQGNASPVSFFLLFSLLAFKCIKSFSFRCFAARRGTCPPVLARPRQADHGSCEEGARAEPVKRTDEEVRCRPIAVNMRHSPFFCCTGASHPRLRSRPPSVAAGGCCRSRPLFCSCTSTERLGGATAISTGKTPQNKQRMLALLVRVPAVVRTMGVLPDDGNDHKNPNANPFCCFSRGGRPSLAPCHEVVLRVRTSRAAEVCFDCMCVF